MPGTSLAGTGRDVLTQQEAASRARRVSAPEYDIRIELEHRAEAYRAVCAIVFDLAPDRDAADEGELFLDFRGTEIEGVEINGEAIAVELRDNRIWLPPALLTPRTEVVVRYHNAYDTTGDGFHCFTDPEDGEQYVYTNFEPFEAHRLFPCFDQPDLKAAFSLDVTAPADWQVITNTHERERETLADGRVNHRFERTPPMSSYLVALICGPFHFVRADDDGTTPLGLYCRRSLADRLEPDELFGITRQGMDFYGELFDRPYPFTKYDQIFVPEFNAGAMENVGAVTFSEDFIFREPPTENQRLERAEVLLHELAHMWFGNLVTMRWWDDLWLNESFATYIAYVALAEATRFRDGSWKAFNAQMKRWAYREDQLVTTHPIAGPTLDTDATFLNFDGITYGKGASVLKQLVAAIGRDGFREGMRIYFRRHAWSNATLADFLAALEEGSGRSLRNWSRLWLETSSLNTIAADWQAADGSVDRFELRQTAPADHPTLRPHALWVAVGDERDDRLVIEEIPATIDGPSTAVTAVVGRPVPAFVFPNAGDHAFAKVELDQRSLAFVREHVERADDALLRGLLWMTLWEMVRDQRLRSTEFLELARRKVVLEPDLEIVESVLGRVQVCHRLYLPESVRERESEVTFRMLVGALPRVAGDARIIWARAAIAVAASAVDVERLGRLADGDEPIEGFEWDQEMRWAIAVKATAFGLPDAERRLAREQERDPSDRGERAVIRARTAAPSAGGKRDAWDRIHGDGHGSLHLTLAAMSGFWWPHQAEILDPYVERFFENVPGIVRDRDRAFARGYVESLFPSYRPDERVAGLTEQVLRDDPGDQPMLARLLRQELDDLRRTIAVRRFAELPSD